MKILFDIGHPAHVHLFKNTIWSLKEKSHEVMITARDKDVSLKLLDAYGLPYIDIGKNQKGLFNKAIGMLKIDYKLYNVANKFQPDLLIGVHNPYIAHVGKLLGRPSITFTDTEHAKIACVITFPFTDVICTPYCFLKKLGHKQIKYNAYHELAYLHPKYFKPDPSILEKVGLQKNEQFFILRFISWNASHDVRYQGFDLETKNQLIKKLEKYARVFISSEGEISPVLEKYQVKAPPEKMHDLLYYATMYIGEGATMATEAGILGTPSIYISPLVGTMGNFVELEKEYDLIYSFRDPQLAIAKSIELVDNKNLKQDWLHKREKLLKDKIDVTKFMTDFIENYLASFDKMKP